MLAAQFGYAPGLMWLVAGICLAGAVQDFITLWASTRRGGRSLADIARTEIGRAAGVTGAIAVLFILVIALAGLGIVVVNALAESAWSMFTIGATELRGGAPARTLAPSNHGGTGHLRVCRLCAVGLDAADTAWLSQHVHEDRDYFALLAIGDNPVALSELVGIVHKDGLRDRSIRIDQVQFADRTPYVTYLTHGPQMGERVLSSSDVAVGRHARAGWGGEARDRPPCCWRREAGRRPHARDRGQDRHRR